MSRRRLSPRSRWFISTGVLVALVAGVLGGVPSAAFALPPSTITLVSDRTEFATGQTLLLTATTDYAATSALPTRIIDQTTGATVKTCTSGTTCSMATFFTTGGPRTYVATVNGLTSSGVTVARTAWTVDLTADKTTFATGETFTLTARTNQEVGLTNYNAYRIRIYDVTTGQVVKYCNQGGGSVCALTSVFYTGTPHTYVADVAAVGNPQTYGSQTDIQAVSSQVVIGRQEWTVSLVADKTTFATGETFTLTARTNQEVGLANYNAYRIRIYDVTTGQMVKYCYQGSGTVCALTTAFYTGGPHTYVADVAAVGNPQTYGSQTDIQAVSSQVVVARQAWTVSLTADKTTFATGETFTLTATTNQQYALTNYERYKVRIYDVTTGQVVKYCSSGGSTTCAITTVFYTGGPHTYAADVAAVGAVSAYGSQTDIQAASSQVAIARQAWTVSLVADKTTFATGETFTLTATTNQQYALTNYERYKVRIYDLTTGQTIKYCSSGGSTTCAITTVFYTGGPHTYVADVAAYGTALTYGSQTDVQAASSEVVAARKAWTVSLSADNLTFAAGESVTLTATVNQDFGITNYDHYKVRIYDVSTGQTIKYCDQGGGTTCAFSTFFIAGGAHTYKADVAATGWASAYGNQTDIQASSNSVVAARKPWFISMSGIKTVSSDGLTVNITLAAAANQNVGSTYGTYQIRIIDSTNGTVVGYCSTGTTCMKSTSRPVGTAAHAYVAVIATGAGGDVQATSKGFSSDTGSGAILAGESTGGQNASENSCQCFAADPVNTATGEFYLPATDLGIPGVGPALEISRTYSSTAAGADSPFGYGWSSGFSSRLDVLIHGDAVDPLPRQVQVTQENGATVAFFEGENQLYWAPTRVMATLTHDVGTGNWTFIRQARDVMVFDSTGRLLQVKDLHGNAITIGYNAANQVASLAASGGRALTLTWAGGHVVQVADSAGRTVSYTYSGGKLTSVTALDGAVTSYGYDGSHYMTTLTKPGGAVTTNVYDSSHRVTSQSDPLGRVTGFSYSASGTTITAPDGSKIVEVYTDGRLMSKTRAATTALAATTWYTYDDASNLTSVTNPLGKVTTFTYDGKGNTLSQKDPLGRTAHWTYNALKQPLTSSDALGRTTTFTYSAIGDLLTATSPAGHVQQWAYNADGTVSSSTNALGNVTAFGYDSSGRGVETTDADGRVTSVALNAAGLMTAASGSDGESATVTSDAAGRPLSVIDPNGEVTSFAYDLRGNQISAADANADATLTAYDLADQVTSITDANGNVTMFTYTLRGELSTVTDANNHTTIYDYDAAGQLASVTDPLNRSTNYEYDKVGRTLSTVLPSGAESSAVYDDAGQVTSVTDALDATVSYAYNAAGQVTTFTDALERVGSTTYTLDGQPWVITRPDSSIESYTYDAVGRVFTYTNPDGKASTYEYSDAGNVTRKTEPGGLATSYSYDGGGRVQTVTLPDGATATRGYDEAGLLTRVHFSESGSTDVTYEYDPAGRVLSMVDSTGTSSFTYDNVGQLLTESNAAGATIGYDYDNAGQLVSITYPGNRTATYAYDAAGQMTSLTDWASRSTTFSYTANGQLAGRVDANGVSEERAYDLVGRLTRIGTSTVAGPLSAFDYGYNAGGQLVSDASSLGGVETGLDYSYDLINQLASVASTPVGGSTATSVLAATPGGLLGTDQSGATLTYNTAQQLTDLVPAVGPAVSFAYDDRGARTSSTVASAPALTTSYEYGPSGALASVTTPTVTVGYTSDGRGLRQSRTVGSVTDQFTWSSVYGLPLLLDDGENTFLYGPSATPVAQIDNATGEVEYLHSDLLGSPRLITDDSGVEVGTCTFDAFGGVASRTGSVVSAIGFSGNWTDPDTGLVYLRARDYDPATGQFLTVDPAVDATRQPYAYVGNNPVMLTDPSGLAEWWDFGNYDAENWQDFGAFAAGVAVGFVVGIAAVAAVSAIAVCTAATAGLCAVGIAVVAGAIAGAAAGAVTYGLQSGEKSWCGLAEAVGLGALGGALGGAIGAGVGALFSKFVAPALKGLIQKVFPRLDGGSPPASVPADFNVDGTTFTFGNRVVQRALEEPGPMHNFPMAFNETIISQGTRATSPSGYIQYSVPGTVNGHAGGYQIGGWLDSAGEFFYITHRFFEKMVG